MLSIGLYIHNYILNIVSGQIKQTSEFQKFFKAAFRNFFWLKNNPKSITEQVHNQSVFKMVSLP